MYVIFPADELILLTYGIAVPRVQPRPTLDNLREPLVPIGNRPSSATILSPKQINEPRRSPERPPRTSTVAPPRTPPILTPRDRSPSVNFSPDDRIYDYDDTTPLYDTDTTVNYVNRDLRPNFPQTSSSTTLRNPSSGGPKSNPSSPTKAKEKPKSRLHLKLGRLRPHSSTEQSESARIREDLQIHVSNPVFTRENLRQRNFDAFFESGETVYSLEKKEKPLPQSADSAEYSSWNTDDPPATTNQRFLSVGVFRRTKSPLSNRAKSVELEYEESQKESSKSHRSIFGKREGTSADLISQRPLGGSMTSSGVLKDLGHPGLNEALKSHNSVTFKLVKTVSDFTETLAQLYEQHAEALQVLVSNYRKRNGELRKERPACQSNLFHAWETFLQEIETDSQATIEVASSLSRQVARPLLERSFYRKVQSRKVFTHRESFDTIIAKTEEKLSKCRIEYKQCFISHRQNPTQTTLTQYIDSHNAYVQQLHATNAMLEAYHCDTLPQLMQELEEIYNDLCNIVAEAVLQGAEAISAKALEQAKRYDSLAIQCKNVSPAQDLSYFVRSIPVSASAQRVPKKVFAPPQAAAQTEEEELADYGEQPGFKNGLVVEKGASIQVRPSLEALKRESQDLEIQIKQLQKELFLGRIDPGSPLGERKMSSSSSSSMKTKWLKAFRSLKPAGSANDSTPKTNQMYHAVSTMLTLRKSGNGAQIRFDGSDNHNLLEYTYKKITPCDVCSQVLRGHTRQGLRCRICKVNVHTDCASQLPKCQVKQKLLRRQKSTSEIENRAEAEEEKPTDVDQIYQVLKKASEISSGKIVEPKAQANITSDVNVTTGSSNPQLEIPVVNVPDYPDRTPRRGPVKSQGSNYQPHKQGLSAPTATDMSSSVPHSPRRQKLNLRMKSLSLDSPESSELHGQIRRRYPGPPTHGGHGGSGGQLEHNTPPSNNSRLHSPSSPSGNQRKFLYASRGMKTGSVDLPDEIERSQSSASTSPCPSPVRQSQKVQRLLPTNIHVVLFNFKARHQDELDLIAGYKVTVIDSSDTNWWKGKCLGKVGYFPSKYCTKLGPSEKVLQVTHPLHITDNERCEVKLQRDQIVVQIAEEVGGMIMVRFPDNHQGMIPSKYLQEV
ncbi:uncharacterized protein LOC129764288 isoform X3 [Toxorhynchites rutilus septentrionalis]|uniref:uncharacterized protein LOC129764288 isoform X3 n=1 Tax=Toxorhynchites rutilus septentrionalis TaxID=329112 RepID=UPI00247AEE47|nr:uncharacterized protein LOC129764288 isoform X3 [Toxorhynchites rutilus septentrionalis]